MNIQVQTTTCLPLVSYGCETWFLTLREGNSSAVLEKRLLSRYLIVREGKRERERERRVEEAAHMTKLKICSRRLMLRLGTNSSVGIATYYGLDHPRIESRWGQDFSHPSRPALEPTPGSYTIVAGSLSRG